MILLVPYTPEVPKPHRPKFWPSIFMVMCLSIAYVETQGIISEDTKYVESVESLLTKTAKTQKKLEQDAEAYLKLRPLLKVAPAKGNWDVRRLIFANFIHGSFMHFFLNAIGLFAGIRILSTFTPLLCSVCIFLVGGGFGLAMSLFSTRQFSEYIPHVGASAGIFALMGAYYAYNFRFRTTYFFWLPIRRGFVSLKTSWFFFFDVVLLELVLSTAQLFPDPLDGVDHIAHVIGFCTGLVLAHVLRYSQGWASHLQSRAEYLYWDKVILPRRTRKGASINDWIELLRINRYNDHLKINLCTSLVMECKNLTDKELNEAFKFLSPTFVRINTESVGQTLRVLLANNRQIPQRWLARTPYDLLIRLAKNLSTPAEDQHLLYEFLIAYKKAQPGEKDVDKKLQSLMTRLEGILKEKKVKQSSLKAG